MCSTLVIVVLEVIGGKSPGHRIVIYKGEGNILVMLYIVRGMLGVGGGGGGICKIAPTLLPQLFM